MKSVFIQLGLNAKCEYACLAYPDVKGRIEHLNPKYTIPAELLDVEDPCTVVGVEMNPSMSKHVDEVYQDNPNVHIWTYCIWHKDIDNFKHGDYISHDEYLPEGETHDHEYIGTAITFETLVEKIKQLEGHQDIAIKGLHVNIEGAEMNLCRSTNWSQFSIPWVRIACEHYNTVNEKNVNQKSKTIVRSIMESYGYTFTPDELYDKDEFLTFRLS